MSELSFPQVGYEELRSRAEVLSRPSPVPQAGGVYAWYFDQVPPGVDASTCYVIDGWTLLYVGISPKEPPTNGRAPSTSTLRKRLQTHFAGNAAGSTLRLTLGCLLAKGLDANLRRVGSGARYTLTNPGEQRLDAWMAEHARVAWRAVAEPWRLERDILGSGTSLPLNIRDNPNLAHIAFVQAARSAARREADLLSILTDSGGPRRPSGTSAGRRATNGAGDPASSRQSHIRAVEDIVWDAGATDAAKMARAAGVDGKAFRAWLRKRVPEHHSFGSWRATYGDGLHAILVRELAAFQAYRGNDES